VKLRGQTSLCVTQYKFDLLVCHPEKPCEKVADVRATCEILK